MTTGVETRASAGIGVETAVRTAPEVTTARKVLIVSYHFPPDAQVGAVRPAKFAKYLRMYGWTPYVLTVREAHLTHTDQERLRELTGIRIERTRVWPTVSSLLLKARNTVMRPFRRRPVGSLESASSRPARNATPADRARPRGVTWHLRRYLDSCFELPDKQIGWLLPAVWRGIRIVKREQIDTILASSPPATTALVGLAISMLTGARLFTDLRDPWYAPIGRSPESSSALSDAIMRRLERLLVRRSTAVVVTTDHYAEFLRRSHGTPPGKVHTIWNGYDPEDLRAVAGVERSPTFTISYLGTFYLGRTPAPFLKALGELVREKRIGRDEIRVRFIGHVREIDGRSVAQMVEAEGLQDCVEIAPPVAYREALRIMKASHVLLLLAPAQYYCIPAKAFEYLAMRRRVLCLSPDGATADLMRRAKAGIVVDPDDVPAIRAALVQLFEDAKNGAAANADDNCAVFERSRLVKHLADLLDHGRDTSTP